VVAPAPPPRLVGRDPERAVLEAVLDATVAGTGGCTTLTGAPGIGKTCLLTLSTREARTRGLAVAPGRAAELDRVAPLTTLVSALQRARPVPVDLSPMRDHEGDRFWYIDRLGEVLESYAARRPLLIVIDDVQWADELSALALRVLVPQLSSMPLRWLLARRPVPADSAGQETLDWLVAEGAAAEIRLAPLDEPSVHRLCSQVVDAEPDNTVLGLVGRCGGNPFLIEQLLGTMLAAGQVVVREGIATVVGDDELPSSFLAAVEQRLRGLTPPARRLLQAGSVFGRPFTVDAVAPLVGTAAPELYPSAEEAVAAGILTERDARLAFRHDLLREAIYNNLSRPVRAAMHRAAAEVTRAEGRSPVEVADHLLRSGHTGDRDAVKVLRVAAAELAGRAPGTAADLIVRALDVLGDHDDDRPALVADAVGLLASAGRLEQAMELGEAALHSGLSRPTEATVLLGLAEALKHAGQNEATVQYANRALALRDVPDPVRARLHAIAAHALLYVDDMAAADRAGADADRLGLAVGEYPASVFGSAARSVVARAEGRLDDALAYAEHAVETADQVSGEAAQRHPRIWLGAALSALDHFAEAHRAYTEGRREAERLGTGWSYPLWHYYRASLLTAEGRLDDAVAEADAGLRIAEQLTARQLSVPLLGLLARLAVLRAQMPLAREHMRRMQRLMATGITAPPEDWAWALAMMQEAEGAFDQARLTLTGIFDRLPERLFLFCNDAGAVPTLVRIALRAGDTERAGRVVAAANSLAERNPTVASLAGAAAHAAGLLHRDVAALRTAIDHFRASPRPLARASAMEDAALAEYGAENRPRAVELLEAALTEATACGARRAVIRMEQRLRRLGTRRAAAAPTGDGPASRLAGLTMAELRVARLVAEGRTNRQVAGQLFISPHTVDSHLRSIYNRLGINSRVELTRVVTEHEMTPPGRPGDIT
jgi:DNA-binding CsgD family transcriptional regulator/tetratricopeptide (TPR) repeat protein